MNLQCITLYCTLDCLCLFILSYVMLTLHLAAPDRAVIRFFYLFLGCWIVSIIGNILYVLMEGGFISAESEIPFYSSYAVYTLFSIYASLVWVICSVRYQNRNDLCGMIVIFITALAFLVITGLVFTTRYHHLMFEIVDGHCVAGRLFAILMMIPFALLGFSCIRSLCAALNKKNYEHRARNFFLASYFFVLCAAETVQFVCNFMIPSLTVFVTILVFVTCEVRLRREITVDSMTQINNRGAMERYLAAEFHEASPFPLYIIMMDVDNFKLINDNFGHYEGDLALKAIANIVKNSIPANYFFARYGGDEFILIGRAETPDAIAALCDTITENLNEFALTSNLKYELRISIGFAVKSESTATIPDLLKAADDNLYSVKKLRKLSR